MQNGTSVSKSVIYEVTWREYGYEGVGFFYRTIYFENQNEAMDMYHALRHIAYTYSQQPNRHHQGRYIGGAVAWPYTDKTMEKFIEECGIGENGWLALDCMDVVRIDKTIRSIADA